MENKDKTKVSDNMQITQNYWMVGYTFGDEGSQHKRFKEDGIWEGRFKNDASMLKKAKSVKQGDVLILKTMNFDEHILEIQNVGIVTSIMEIKEGTDMVSCECNVKYSSTQIKDFIIDNSTRGRYNKTIEEATNDSKIEEIRRYVDSILDSMCFAKCFKLLKTNYNLVLTGAPGTGKTFMAKEIAKAMGCEEEEIGFVQFHPSYDYTDFVDGLRPVNDGNGHIGFERRDGEFKEFCQVALQNLIDSNKTKEERTEEQKWSGRIKEFVNDAIDGVSKFNILSGSEFRITYISDKYITVSNEENPVTQKINVPVSDVLELLIKGVVLNKVRDVRDHFNRKNGTQADSYTFAIVNEIRKGKEKVSTTELVKKEERKPFVFIIDEINRGEASKIFGELFYAIDPGYRGKKGKVMTQYQNLIEDGETFSDGFYVPENVYIIGTMNDIDRSVESMDFAMRRRFTWVEVTPEDTQDEILECLGGAVAQKAKDCMKRLNEKIKGTDGLGRAYQIGAAYFRKLGKDVYDGNYKALWDMNLEPLLREYLRGFGDIEEKMKEFETAYLGEVVTEKEDKLGE